ncbi:hypothetical protein GO755_02615 [Spirosoma sp. HMF4905]|uniref:Uncharacterized protein n=1 Tax=Spirosoma arboris TaxID=2682092 RepID=A0A7K1S5A0_9BACT|nr:hypothetical protein [Spirosoma arboris]MVM28910.1 hypothetical protein [Spirosoma arboris]
MGLAAQFETIIERQLNVHAAWVPITDPFRLGDYGQISDGVFQKLGNITDDFGVSFNVGNGKDVSFNFISEKTVVVDLGADAGVNINPQAEIKANVTYKFQKDESFLINAPIINVSIIDNVNQVAIKLKEIDGWKRKFIVVSKVYTAKNALVIGANEGGTEVTISADGSGLEQFNVGEASVKFSLKTNKKLGLEIKGETGVIALGLFKLKLIGGGPTFLGGEVEEEEESNEAPFEDLDGQKLSEVN